MICLSRSLAAEVFRYLEGHYPNEACGVFFGRRGTDGEEEITGAKPIPNVNTERARDRYELDPRAQLAAEKEARGRGEAVIGVYHSHPDHPASPSPTDLGRAWPELTYMIVSVREGRTAEWTCWRLDEAAGRFVPRVVKLSGPVD